MSLAPILVTATGNLGDRFLLEFLLPLDTSPVGMGPTEFVLFSELTGITTTITGTNFGLDENLNPVFGTVASLVSVDADGNQVTMTGMQIAAAEFFDAFVQMAEDDLTPTWDLLSRQPLILDVSGATTGQDLGIGPITSSVTVLGSDFNDRIYGALGDDVLYGGSGNDRIFDFDGVNSIFGGAGHDYITTFASGGVVNGGLGRDFIYAAGAEGSFGLPSELVRANGGAGNDLIILTGNAHRAYGGNGHDIIAVDGPDGRAYGGTGNDIIGISGGAGRAYGGLGNDLIVVNNWNGVDMRPNRAFGGDGDDTLVAMTGGSDLVGGNGADMFVFAFALDTSASTERARVRIRDFNATEGDTIVIATYEDQPEMTVDELITAYGRQLANGDLQLRLGVESLTLIGVKSWDDVRDSIELRSQSDLEEGLNGFDSAAQRLIDQHRAVWGEDEDWLFF
jgi:Ca2+-binding RTX toxin-like protein